MHLFDLIRIILMRSHASFQIDFARLVEQILWFLALINTGLEFSELFFVVFDPRFCLLDLPLIPVDILLKFKKFVFSWHMRLLPSWLRRVHNQVQRKLPMVYALLRHIRY